MSLTLIFATRERPNDILRTLAATLPNVEREDTKVLVCADMDDSATCDALFSHADLRVVLSVEKREDSRGEKYDRALRAAPGSIYLVGHDCAPILTPGFDQIILDKAERCFPDGIGVVNTPMANASFPGLQAMTARFVEKMGYIYSHEYPFWFIDHEIDDIARMIGRDPFVEVEVEIGPRRPGRTLRLRELKFWTTYFNAMTIERRRKAHDIINGDDFLAPQWLKEIALSWHPKTEARSLWINNGVFHDAEAIERDRGEQGEPDEGYRRLRTGAEAKLMRVMADLEKMAA